MQKHLRTSHEDQIDTWKAAGFVNSLISVSERSGPVASSSSSPAIKMPKYQKKIKINNTGNGSVIPSNSGSSDSNNVDVRKTAVQNSGQKYTKKCDRPGTAGTMMMGIDADTNNNRDPQMQLLASSNGHYGPGKRRPNENEYDSGGKKKTKNNLMSEEIHTSSPILPAYSVSGDDKQHYLHSSSMSTAVTAASAAGVDEVPYFYNLHHMSSNQHHTHNNHPGISAHGHHMQQQHAFHHPSAVQHSHGGHHMASGQHLPPALQYHQQTQQHLHHNNGASSRTLMAKFQQTLDGLDANGMPNQQPSHQQQHHHHNTQLQHHQQQQQQHQQYGRLMGWSERGSAAPEDENSFENFYEDYMVL